MVVLNEEELAMLLHETCLDPDDWLNVYDTKKPEWPELAEHSKDEYRYQARAMLKKVRVATKPETKTCGKCGSKISPGPCPICNDAPYGKINWSVE